MTKINLIFILLALSSFGLSAQQVSTQDSIRVFADSTFALMKDYALYAEKVNLDSSKIAFDKKSKAFKRFEEVFSEFQKIFDQMQDNHSFFWYNNQKYASNYGQLDESSIRKPLMDAFENGEATTVAKTIHNIGYIRIPQDNSSDDFMDMQQSAQKLHDAICEIYDEDIKGWIIDLRLNTGGNMYPMIGGLIPFLGEGTFASKIDRNDHKENWNIQGKSVFEGQKEITKLKTLCLPDLTASKVAILTSQLTGSSGEITALAFLNRPNTVFIGERSAGYMTSNELFRLPFETFLLLANANETDKEGNLIKHIKPQLQMVDGDNFKDLEKDEKIKEGIRWINQN